MAKLLYTKKLPQGKFEVYDQRPAFEVLRTNQVHSAQVTAIGSINSQTQSDGILYSLDERVPLAIITADCLPVILLGASHGVFLHAGWRGLAQDILASKEVESINPNYIFIGPHISWTNYEVSPEFQEEFPHSASAFKTQEAKILFSMELELKRQVKNLYGPITVESSNICTYENESFHSFRRNRTNSRNWNIFVNN